jgi:hypothetical protein
MRRRLRMAQYISVNVIKLNYIVGENIEIKPQLI